MELRDYLEKPELRRFADLWQDVKEDRLTIRSTGAVIIFPVENEPLTERLLDGAAADAAGYDYHSYDRSLDSAWLDTRRVGMILMRLKYPVDLAPETAQVLRARIASQMEKILKRIAADDNAEDLELLCELGFVTAENVDACVRVLREAGRRDLMVRLMNWKHTAIHKTFDFSL